MFASTAANRACGAVGGSHGCAATSTGPAEAATHRETARRVYPSLLAPRYQVQIPVRVDIGEGRRWASLGEAIQNDLDHLVTDHPMARGLGALALTLAASLDTCEDRQIAPLARELKAALYDLMNWRPRVDSGW